MIKGVISIVIIGFAIMGRSIVNAEEIANCDQEQIAESQVIRHPKIDTMKNVVELTEDSEENMNGSNNGDLALANQVNSDSNIFNTEEWSTAKIEDTNSIEWSSAKNEDTNLTEWSSAKNEDTNSTEWSTEKIEDTASTNLLETLEVEPYLNSGELETTTETNNSFEHSVTISFEVGEGIRLNDAYIVVREIITQGEVNISSGQEYEMNNQKLSIHFNGNDNTEIASQFNAKTSGYNDGSVTGDRNFFHKPVNKLSFMIVGDIFIKATKDNIQSNLQFNDFIIGFEKDYNKLWFGQTTGQHTKNSDEINSLLMIGNNDQNNQVFASFETNDAQQTINLNNYTVIKEPVDYSPKVDNILQKLKELPTEGTLLTSKNYSGFYDPTVNHIQGHSVYTNHNGIIFDIYTHSVKSADYAHIFVSNRTTGQTIGFNTFGLNQRHPGGINIIGDYLVVPTEDNNKSTIAMYDLRSLDVGELRRVEDFQLNLSHKAGSLALIDYHQDGKDYYLMMVAHLDGKNSVYHVYRAEKQNNIETAKFEKVSELPFSKDFHGNGLVKNRNKQNIYIIG